jgi:hypothetical protein
MLRYRPSICASGSLSKEREGCEKSLKMGFEEALTYALDDLRENWETYKNEFLGE